MFEEATLYKSSHSNYSPRKCSGSPLKTSKHSLYGLELTLSQGKTAICQHKRQKSLVRLWLAQGLIKTNVKWFLYIEYQNSAGNNRYIQKPFNSQKEAIAYAENEALNQSLPIN